MRRIFDALDNVPWSPPHTEEKMLERIRTRSPRYVLAYIKSATEHSCYMAMKVLLDPPPQRRKPKGRK